MAITPGRHVKWKKFSAAFSEALLSCEEELTGFGRRLMCEECAKWIQKTDAEWPHSTSITKIKWGPNNVRTQRFGGDAMHPWYYGQLHDSVVVRVSEGNKTVAIEYMPQRATSPQKATASDAGANYSRIIGAEWAVLIARQAEHTYWKGSKAVQAQLLVGVPYAQKVNESSRHGGFLDELNAQFASYLEDQMTIRSEGFRTRVVRPKKK